MKVIRRVFLGLLFVLILALVGFSIFAYKAVKGINFYETTPHELPADITSDAILLFNKTNGFPHNEGIRAATTLIEEICTRHNWVVYTTKDAGVFNQEQLAKFKVVIWNSVTGKVLTEDQRAIFKAYILNGGTFIGIHGAGDNSHQWEWYEDELIGARFSHHPLSPQIQEGVLHRQDNLDDIFRPLDQEVIIPDEWYVFKAPPSDAFQVIYKLDEAGLSMNGNLGFLVKDKDFGMGSNHPIVWYHRIGQGKAFYSALGHNRASFEAPEHRRLIEAALVWGME